MSGRNAAAQTTSLGDRGEWEGTIFGKTNSLDAATSLYKIKNSVKSKLRVLDSKVLQVTVHVIFMSNRNSTRKVKCLNTYTYLHFDNYV